MSKVLTNKDPKLVFLTGDYHCGIHGKIKHEGSEEGQGEWHEFMAGPLNQVLVNPANVFEKERTLLVDKEQNIKVEYKRMQVESKFTNVGSVRIDKEEGFYTVQVTWYRAQHESGVEEIGRTAVVRLKS